MSASIASTRHLLLLAASSLALAGSTACVASVDGIDDDGGGGGGVGGILSEPPGGAGAVARWLVAPGDAARVVRPDFFGLHVERTTGWPDYQPVPLPTFGYGLVRSLDHNSVTTEVALQWARIEVAPGQFDWSAVDAWIADTAGRTRIFTVAGTPPFYQKYPGEPYRYPYLPGGASPPADPAAMANFIGALLARHPGQIQYVEVANEPNMTWVSSDSDGRWDPGFAAANGPAFFAGSPSDLAELARVVRASLPEGVRLMAGAWEGQTGASDVSSLRRFTVAPDRAGGIGRDAADVFSFHHYIYHNDPNGFLDSIDAYRARMAEYGYPAGMEFHCSEIGHESPTPASSLSTDDVARNIRRATSLGAAAGLATMSWYRYSSAATLGAPFANPAIEAALAEAASLAGRTIVQAAVLTDGRVWVELDDGSQRTD
ncbi:MAG: hypothetical protein KBG28_21545 [Kofleriaceae bacterium]|nr:hypothetical protein [Kofleriaceae bacterium]